MTYLLDSISFSNIIEITTGIIIGLIFTFFVWIVKNAYSIRKKEVAVIAEIERLQVHNLSILKDYQFLLRGWIDELTKKNPYIIRFSQFYIPDHSKTVSLNIKFVNNFFPVILKLKRLEDDVFNIYESYAVIASKHIFLDSLSGVEKMKWISFNAKVLPSVKLLLEKAIIYEDKIIENIAYCQLLFQQKTISPFLILDKLNKTIFPLINKKKIQKRKKSINKEQIKKEKISEKSKSLI